MNNQLVDVFPINRTAFGFSGNWFETFVPQFIEPAYLLLVLLLVISIGIMVLRRFEDVDLEKKLWNLPIIITLIVLWPFLVVGLKSLIDAFNTFLAVEIFQLNWNGFGWPEPRGGLQFLGWSVEAIVRFLPIAAYWIVYAFFLVFFFFFAVLGPFILAKGVLFDEIEAFLELLKELTILFLWQTTILIFVGFILPEIVSGERFPSDPENNVFFLSLILGILIFFTPTVTRKFGNHLGSSFIPPGFKWGGLMLGLTAVAKVGTGALAVAGAPLSHNLIHRWHAWKHRFLSAEEFSERYRHTRHGQHLEREKHQLEHRSHVGHRQFGGSQAEDHSQPEHEHQHSHDHGHRHEHQHHLEQQNATHKSGQNNASSKVVSIFGTNSSSSNLFEGKMLNQSSLALHFKSPPGSKTIGAMGNKVMTAMQIEENQMLDLLKKAKRKTEDDQGDKTS